ncbi:hypothetical protein K469DRAFT_693112 [Zopfia rhizophila CBS 207.26]|uniref:BTB domain-containing protein n=1 Tax=Zopfia rhizophila CBS 207.26 TaxID=1314779 RepID=A0A6A6ET28_9PEZI|nr:hypothetical protein K469DRAFT_693112 [Zopfia rhizophila CBS 207.26]
MVEWSGSDSGWLCSDTIYLPDMDEDTGHVLVHYLYTGTYQTLDNKDASPVVERSIEFKRAVLAYFAAKNYELLGLQRLAVYKIEHFGIEMNIFDIIEAINEDFSKLPGNTSWFHDYLRRKAKAAFQEDHTVFARNAFLDRISNVDLNKVLVKYVVELYTNKISRMLNNGAESILTLSGKSVPDAVDTPREEVPTDEPTTEEPAVEEPTAEEPVVATEEPAEELHVKDPEWVLRLFRNFTGSELIKLPLDADVASLAVNVDDVWGPSLKKRNKKKAREVSPVPLLPDLAADVTPLVVNVDNSWGLPLKKGKKKKAREVLLVPLPPNPPAGVTSLTVNVDDSWEPSLKNGKKKKVREVSLVPLLSNPPADVASLVVNIDNS